MSATVSSIVRQPRRARTTASAPPLSQQIALVTGANRGIGLEVTRQLSRAGVTVLLGARDRSNGEKVAEKMRRAGLDVVAVKLDVTSDEDIDAVAGRIEADYGRLDILVNNAGGYFDIDDHPSSVAIDTVRAALDTNLLGAWRLNEALLPIIRKHGYGRIVHVSSGCGANGADGDCCPAYRVSKAALNAYTRMLAAELAGSGVTVNAVCPGWVATDLGGAGGRPVAEGAAGIVAACKPEHGATGGFFRDQLRIDW